MLRVDELRSRLENAGFTSTALECACDSIENTRGVIAQLLRGLNEEAVSVLTDELWKAIEEQRASICRKRSLRYADRVDVPFDAKSKHGLQ